MSDSSNIHQHDKRTLEEGERLIDENEKIKKEVRKYWEIINKKNEISKKWLRPGLWVTVAAIFAWPFALPWLVFSYAPNFMRSTCNIDSGVIITMIISFNVITGGGIAYLLSFLFNRKVPKWSDLMERGMFTEER